MRKEEEEAEEDAVDRTCRLPRRCVAKARPPLCIAARCFTVKQKEGGVGGGRARRGRKREGGRSGPREARGHSRLCKPYRSVHYLAARRLSNNIMVQRQRGP